MYVTLFGKRFFADVTKLRGAHTELGWALVHCGLPRWLSGKESAGQCRRCAFDSWVGKVSQRRKEQPTPVFLPGKSHGQRNLVVYSPWGHKESNMPEHVLISPVAAMLRKEKFVHRHTEREDGPLKTEVEIGVVLPHAKDAKDCWQSPEARTRQWRLLSQSLWRH